MGVAQHHFYHFIKMITPRKKIEIPVSKVDRFVDMSSIGNWSLRYKI